jgi:hypothetical protein
MGNNMTNAIPDMMHKGSLAKLLAGENITIRIEKTKTAHFNVETRILVIPLYVDGLSESLYNTFIAHEVGHAIATPHDFHKKIAEMGIPHDIFNIIEDIRIERMIKFKYPGLKKDFHHGYGVLLARNSFGIKDKDVNSLEFIDRINLFYKCGSHLNISFSKKEMVIIHMIEDMYSVDDVYNVCRALMKHYKLNFSTSSLIDIGEISSPIDENEITPIDEDEISSPIDENKDEEEYDTPDQLKNNGQYGEIKEEKRDSEKSDITDAPDIKSITFESLEEDLQSLTEDMSDTTYINYNLPEKINTDKIIIPYNECMEMFGSIISENGKNIKIVDTFLSVHAEAIKYMIGKFNRKKSAMESQRIPLSRHGMVDSKRISQYYRNPDIFRKPAPIRDIKSHGMVLFLDWSGSMYSELHNSMIQLCSLLEFCRKIRVPYEVYAFTNNATLLKDFVIDEFKDINSQSGLIFNPMKLFNLFSSKMNKEQHYKMVETMLLFSADYIENRTANESLKLYGTPLNEAIIMAMDIVPKFQKKHNVQIVNTVFISDGVSDWNNYSATKTTYYINDNITKYNVKYDPSSKKQDLTLILLEHLRMRTKSFVAGVFINSGPIIGKNNELYWGKKKYSPSELSKFTTDYSSGGIIIEEHGYDRYYIINAKKMRIDNKEITNAYKTMKTPSTKNKIFSVYLDDRIKNRMILSNFIDMIS